MSEKIKVRVLESRTKLGSKGTVVEFPAHIAKHWVDLGCAVEVKDTARDQTPKTKPGVMKSTSEK